MTQDEKDRLKIAIDICHAIGRGERVDHGFRTNAGLKAHADYIRSIATSIKLAGGQVNEDYR